MKVLIRHAMFFNFIFIIFYKQFVYQNMEHKL